MTGRYRDLGLGFRLDDEELGWPVGERVGISGRLGCPTEGGGKGLGGNVAAARRSLKALGVVLD